MNPHPPKARFDPIAYTQARPWLMVGGWMLYLALFTLWYWWHIPPAAGSAVGSGDPDVLVRLGLVRDLLQGGGWYHHLVAHSNATFGTISPWTRPMDVLLALFVLPQPAGWPMHLRLLYAAGPVPALMGMGLVYALWLGARRIVPLPETGWYTVLILGLTFLLNPYFMPGDADHHGLMALSWSWALVLLLHPRGGAGHGAGAGALLGLIFWVSPEGLAPAGIVVGWFGLLWLMGSAKARQLTPLLWGMAGMVAAALMIERPPAQWLVPVYDSLSIVQVWVVGVTAVLGSLLLALPARLTRQAAMRLAWGVGAMLLELGLIFWVYPDFFRGPLVGVDPFIFTDFLPAIHEARSLARVKFLFALAITWPVLGLLAMAIWIARTRTASVFLPWQLGLLACALGGTWVLVAIQIRWIYYLLPVQILMLVPLTVASLFAARPAIARLWPASLIARLPQKRADMARGAAPFFLLLVPTVMFLLSDQLDPPKSDPAGECQQAARVGIQHGMLDQLGRRPLTLLTSTDLGGEVLFWSPHRIIASNYHREGPGIRYVWQAEGMTDEAALRAHLADRRVEALLICPSPRSPKESVFQRWRDTGRLPAWVRRVPLGPAPLGHKPLKAESRPLLLRVQPGS